MRLIKAIIISIFIILVFQRISLAQSSLDKHEPGAKQVQAAGESTSKTTDNSKQIPEIEIVMKTALRAGAFRSHHNINLPYHCLSGFLKLSNESDKIGCLFFSEDPIPWRHQ